jgi:membrane carboxypeptidase/penicillin-binding protein PbpC
LTPSSLLAYAPDSDYECTMHLYNENIENVELDKDDNALIIISEKDDTYHLKASNNEEAKSWIDAILNIIRSN